MNKSVNRAFTLIELLVVIAIIAILAAILFPVFAQAREKARAISCLSNIKQVNMSWQMYLQDYDETMVPMWTAGDPVTGNDIWPKLLDPYTKSWAIYHCPSAADPDGFFSGGSNAWYGNQMWYGNVGYNYLDLGQWDACGNTMEGLSLAGVDKPASTVAFADSTFEYAGSTSVPTSAIGFSMVNAPVQYATILPAPITCTWYNGVNGGWDWKNAAAPAPDMMGFAAPRHMGGMNVGWVDGHAKYQKWQALTAGTNFGPGVTDANVTLTNPDQYLWGLYNTSNVK